MPKTATQTAPRSVKLLRDIPGAASLRADLIAPVEATSPGMVCVKTASGTPMWLSLDSDCQWCEGDVPPEKPKKQAKLNEHGVFASGRVDFTTTLPKTLQAHAIVCIAERKGQFYWSTDFQLLGGGTGCGGWSSYPSLKDKSAPSREAAIVDGLTSISVRLASSISRGEYSSSATNNRAKRVLALVNEAITRHKEKIMPTANELNKKKPTVKPSEAARWDAAAKQNGANGSTKRGAKSQPGPSSPAASPAAPASKPPEPMPDVIEQIPLEKLHPHPRNRVVDIPKCSDLAERMKSGQLTPIIVRPAESIDDELNSPPIGHYQILAGERRYRAAMINGWETIAAQVRDVGDAEALRILVEENAQREDLTDIEKAESIETLCLPVDEGGAGYTREQAGAIYSLSAGAASNLVRLLELPQLWRDRLSKGELPQTFARELLPYVKHDKLIKVIDAEIAKDVKEDGAVTCSRADFSWLIYNGLREATRSLERGQYDGPKFKVTAELEEKLEVVTLPKLQHHPERQVALNTKLWDKLQAEAKNAKLDPHADRGPKGKQKAAKEKPKPPTAAELAAKAKEAAERTKKAIAAWRLMFLREILAQTLDYSRMAGVTHLFDIWLDARPYAPSGAHTQDLLSAAIKAAGGKTVPSHSPATKYMAAAAEIDRNDRWKVKLELTRLILRDEVELPAALIEPLALECEIEIEEWWRKWQTEGRAKIVAELIERFFGLHTTDQLVALAGELGVGVMPGAKKSNLVNTLATYHRSGRTLALPKSIAPLKEPRKSPKKEKAKS